MKRKPIYQSIVLLLALTIAPAWAESDAKPTPAEKLIERFDQTGDQTLNAEELEEAITFLRERRMQAMRENRSEPMERGNRPERMERKERPERGERPERMERRERPERVERERGPNRQRFNEDTPRADRQSWRDMSPEERRAARQERTENHPHRRMAERMIERFDENKDGQLNQEELARLIEWMQENRRGSNRPNR